MNDGVDPAAAASGFRNLRIVAKVPESAVITSFHLEAADGGTLSAFRPGQFLVLKIPTGDARGHVLRNYTLSGSPDEPSRYRISVKREPATAPGLPVGLCSNHLHDRLAVGDLAAAQGPRGQFTLDESSDRPVVLLSGGVGLTPMVSMLHALAGRSSRRVLFLHACEDGGVHALREEVERIASIRPGLSTHYCYRTPSPEDRASGRFDSEGFVTRETLQSLLPLDDYEFYLCGPPPFMQALYTSLRGLGVANERIATEFFGPATVLDADVASPPHRSPEPAAAAPGDGTIAVEFRRSGIVAAWDPAVESLLAFAENQGLAPAFSCRAGICGSCRTGILFGEVTYFEEPLDEVEAGALLLCCSRPKTPVVLDL